MKHCINSVKKAMQATLDGRTSQRQAAKDHGLPESTLRFYIRKSLGLGGWGRKPHEPLTFKQEGPNILIFDIETAPIKSYHWGLFKQNISLGQIIEDWYVLCWSAKWLGNYEVINNSVHHHAASPEGLFAHNEKAVVSALWELLNKADIVVAFNGKKFDTKKMNAKFYQYGLPEPLPYTIVDPMLTVKSNMALTSNKMDYVVSVRHDDAAKMATNFGLWVRCDQGDVKSLDYMQEYCDMDIDVLEKVYMTTRPWNRTHPNVALYYSGNEERCICCGSTNIQAQDKVKNTGVSSFLIYRCGDCGKNMRGRQNILSKEKRNSLFMNVPR